MYQEVLAWLIIAVAYIFLVIPFIGTILGMNDYWESIVITAILHGITVLFIGVVFALTWALTTVGALA